MRAVLVAHVAALVVAYLFAGVIAQGVYAARQAPAHAEAF